ncbi:hypothetical protein VTK73DRAFT_1969 [Phialemonium thermophilum]|uniref:FAD-binding FR-type domain-containing protein n=1 Tax=Phialemonium thermophilum TaxID=223376 RepID=A0ABR3VSY1_9PEZI
MTSAVVASQDQDRALGFVIVRSPNFWFVCLTTSCTLLSWSRLRLHRVYTERLSAHATRLRFRYRSMPPFYGVKLSDSPLTEWHAFATIPDVNPATGEPARSFSVVVSNAGDWTKKQIDDDDASGERRLWVRGAPLHGVLYTSRLFQQIVLVATGSGIGPCLSLLSARATSVRVLWSTRDPLATYGEAVVRAVERADPQAVIWNTTARGYPDIV